MRKRLGSLEMHELDVQGISQLILLSAKSYENLEGYSKEVSLEVAMSDFSFWFNSSQERQKDLEKLLYKK